MLPPPGLGLHVSLYALVRFSNFIFIIILSSRLIHSPSLWGLPSAIDSYLHGLLAGRGNDDKTYLAAQARPVTDYRRSSQFMQHRKGWWIWTWDWIRYGRKRSWRILMFHTSIFLQVGYWRNPLKPQSSQQTSGALKTRNLPNTKGECKSFKCSGSCSVLWPVKHNMTTMTGHGRTSVEVKATALCQLG
jgi:hypothetical protein